MSMQPVEASGGPEPASFQDELQACLPALRARALKLCLNRSEAQDLVQDTVERSLRFQSTFRPGSNLKAWTQQVLFSVFVTRCRKRQREQRALEGFSVDPNSWTLPKSEFVRQGLSPRVASALDGLPDKFRSVVHLVDLHELSYREAAEALDVPVGTVMSRLFRGRRQLALVLGETLAATEVPAAEAA